MKPDLRLLLEVIAGIAVIGTGIYAFGRFDGRLDQIEQRLGGLENRVDPLRALKIGKGDLCLKMLEQWGTTRDGKRSQELREQWNKSGCDAVPAAMLNALDDAGPPPPPPPPQPEQ